MGRSIHKILTGMFDCKTDGDEAALLSLGANRSGGSSMAGGDVHPRHHICKTGHTAMGPRTST